MPTITAVATFAGSMADKGALGRRIEAAMVEAIKQAMRAGVQDQGEIKARMLAARESVWAEVQAAHDAAVAQQAAADNAIKD